APRASSRPWPAAFAGPAPRARSRGRAHGEKGAAHPPRAGLRRSLRLSVMHGKRGLAKVACQTAPSLNGRPPKAEPARAPFLLVAPRAGGPRTADRAAALGVRAPPGGRRG